MKVTVVPEQTVEPGLTETDTAGITVEFTVIVKPAFPAIHE